MTFLKILYIWIVLPGCFICNIMKYEVEYTDEFETWWNTLTDAQKEDVDFSVNLLGEKGPFLRFPHSSAVYNSKHSGMRELRAQSHGHPLRIFYIFDPRRNAILLIGGDKTGNDRFYAEMVPKADIIYRNAQGKNPAIYGVSNNVTLAENMVCACAVLKILEVFPKVC